MCSKCVKSLVCYILVANSAIALTLSLWSVVRYTYERNAYYQTFIGRKVLIKNNGKTGIIGEAPNWTMGSSAWLVRDVTDRVYLRRGEELKLIEETLDH